MPKKIDPELFSEALKQAKNAEVQRQIAFSTTDSDGRATVMKYAALEIRQFIEKLVVGFEKQNIISHGQVKPSWPKRLDILEEKKLLSRQLKRHLIFLYKGTSEIVHDSTSGKSVSDLHEKIWNTFDSVLIKVQRELSTNADNIPIRTPKFLDTGRIEPPITKLSLPDTKRAVNLPAPAIPVTPVRTNDEKPKIDRKHWSSTTTTNLGLLIVALLALAVWAMSASDEAINISSKEEAYTTIKTMNVREAPTTESAIKGKLTPNVRLYGKVTTNADSPQTWVQFRYNGNQVGYVWIEGLAKSLPVPPQPSSQTRGSAANSRESTWSEGAVSPRREASPVRSGGPEREISQPSIQKPAEPATPLINCYLPSIRGRAPETVRTTSADCTARSGLEE